MPIADSFGDEHHGGRAARTVGLITLTTLTALAGTLGCSPGVRSLPSGGKSVDNQAGGGGGDGSSSGAGGSDNGTAPGGPRPGAAPSVALTWTVESSGTGDPLVAVWGASSREVYVVGESHLLRSRGDGVWSALATPNADDQLSAVFAQGGAVYAVGSTCPNGLCADGVLLRTRDGGQSWMRKTFVNNIAGAIAGGNDELYVGLYGSVFYSRTGFDDYEQVDAPSAELHALLWSEPTQVLAVGGLSSLDVLGSFDHGQSWQTMYNHREVKSAHLYGIARAGVEMWTVGSVSTSEKNVGEVLRSGDAGRTWQALGELPALNAVWASGGGDLWVAGEQLLRSSDGGSSFTPVTLPVTPSYLYGVWGSGPRDIYVVGQDGVILHGH